MRTITKTLFDRLLVQAQESELQGLTKTAESLTSQLEVNSSKLRDQDSDYSYSQNELQKDLNDKLWEAVIRTADYYGINHLDAHQVQQLIDKVGANMMEEIQVLAGINHGVGAYEPQIPGEIVEKVSLEVDE